MYQELPAPESVSAASWQALKPGTYISFASPDIRYAKNTAPTIYVVGDEWQTKAWKGEKIHTQLLIYTTEPLGKVSILMPALPTPIFPLPAISSKISSLKSQIFTFVVPPPLRDISTGLFSFHEPLVKSGTSMDVERLATDHSLKGATALHKAAS